MTPNLKATQKDSIDFILYGRPALRALLMFPENLLPVQLWPLDAPEIFCQKAHSHTFFWFSYGDSIGKGNNEGKKDFERRD